MQVREQIHAYWTSLRTRRASATRRLGLSTDANPEGVVYFSVHGRSRHPAYPFSSAQLSPRLPGGGLTRPDTSTSNRECPHCTWYSDWTDANSSTDLIQPFVPDFWDSSKVKAKEQPGPTEPDNPKVLVVAGATTQISGGPSHHLYFESESAPPDASPEVFESQDAPRTDPSAARGAWTLIGLLFGSWVVAGLAAPKSEIEGEAHHH